MIEISQLETEMKEIRKRIEQVAGKLSFVSQQQQGLMTEQVRLQGEHDALAKLIEADKKKAAAEKKEESKPDASVGTA